MDPSSSPIMNAPRSEQVEPVPVAQQMFLFQGPASVLITAVSAVILLASLGAIVWFSATLPRLQRFDDPDRALELMVSRTMEADEGLRAAPAWEQRLNEWTTGDRESEQAQAIQWYEELVEDTDDPLSRLRLAVLEGEAGRAGDALRSAKTWRTMGEPLPLYADLIEAAYGSMPLDLGAEVQLQAVIAEILPAGWFYHALASRLAQRAGDGPLGAVVAQQRALRADSVYRWARGLMAIEIASLVAGTLVLLHLLRLGARRRDAMRLHAPGVPPPWPAGIGAAVLLRGGALGAVITLAFLSLAPAEHVSLRALAIPLANLPLMGLASFYLLRPAGLTFRDGFGLTISRAQVGRVAGLLLAAMAAGWWGEWVMGRVSDALSLTNHWTEWFDPDLVWAAPSVLAISLLEYVVFAPIFEELVFRGLLYAALRRRLGVAPAALISAAIFALAHGYGAVGFISVLWSGLLWAWLYERTGSLVPGILAHAANNLLVCAAVMTLLR
jgi:membrane protease YdiL (CAAX protease family)